MRRRLGLVVAAAALAVAGGTADASRPLQKQVDACVIHGALKGDPFVYRPFVWAQGKQRELDLSTFEGLALHVEGFLYPGDRLGVSTITVTDKRCG